MESGEHEALFPAMPSIKADIFVDVVAMLFAEERNWGNCRITK